MYKTLEAAAKAYGSANGFAGRTGGWIYFGTNATPFAHGWQSAGQRWMRHGKITGNEVDGYQVVGVREVAAR